MSAEPAPAPNRLRNHTQERLTEIMTLWNAGTTSSQIAARFGLTRSAVIALVYRCKDANKRRQKPKAAKRPPRPFIIASRPEKAPVKRSLVPLKPEPYLVLPDEPPLIHSVDMLENNHCRWPVGDPQDINSDFGFCGQNRDGSSSYCAKHKARAMQQPQVEEQQKTTLVAAE